MRFRSTLIPAALLSAALVLTGCGGDSQSPGTSGHDMGSMNENTPTPSITATPAAGEHNAADVTFATNMIGHHAQAIEMADMAAEQASKSEIRELASRIKAAQAPEINQMSGWLTGWGEPVPDTSTSGGGMTMGEDGMMTEEEMTALHEATGEDFDRMWLEMMIRHHQGAVAMATTEQKSGSNADAKDVAQKIITSQQAEIEEMQQLRAGG